MTENTSKNPKHFPLYWGMLNRFGGSATLHYTIALLLLAFAAITSHSLLVSSLSELDEDSEVINTSGRQRMLSEQTVRLAGELMVETDPATTRQLREELSFSLDLMRSSHKTLAGDAKALSSFGPEAELKAAYFYGMPSLDERLSSYFSAIESILEANSDAYRTDLDAYQQLVAAHRGGILRDLDGVVRIYEEQAKRRLQASEDLHVQLMLGTLALLLIEALFIFRPLIRRLTKANDVLQEQNQTMRTMAVSDTLTQLPNRSGFGERLEALVRTSPCPNSCSAAMMLDLDRFKSINDALGHPAGDQVLVEVAERIREKLKKVDTVARLGGDEFAIIARRLEGPKDAAAIAQRVIDAICKPILLPQGEVFVGASIGIATFTDASIAAEDMIKYADLALYEAKNAGRRQFKFYEPSMQNEAMRKTSIAEDLKSAQLEDQLKVFLQPIMSLETGKIEYAEALIRWLHPDKGLIPATEFITVVEEFMLAPQLEMVVYDQVFSQVAEWKRKGIEHPKVSINTSGVNLKQADFCERIMGKIQEYDLSPAMFGVEISESLFLDQRAAAAIANITQLHQLGFEIMLDDFGTGYASLSHLMQMPVDTIKIDKSFVWGIGSEEVPEQIASALLVLANDLSIKTIGEGVETQEQLSYLRSKGCDFGQGYHFSKPLPMAEFNYRLQAGDFAGVADTIWRREVPMNG